MMRDSEGLELKVLYGAAALLVIALFLLSVRPVLSPVVLFLAVALVLSPWAGTRPHLLLVLTTGLLTALWLLETVGMLLAPFILALVLAYILDPAVDALERRRIRRGWAILLLGLPVAMLAALAIAFGIPALAEQVESIIRRAPELVRRLAGWAEAARARLLVSDLPGIDEDALFSGLRSLDAERVQAFVVQQQEEIARRTWDAVMGVGRGVGAVLTVLGYVVLTPVLTFYLLRDYDRITGFAAGLIPPSRRDSWLGFMSEYDRLLSAYLRGQVLAAAIVGVLTWLGLWIVGFPSPGVVAVVAGVFNLVPYLGLVVSVIPAVIISLISGNVLLSLLKAGIVFVIVQFIDGSVTGPRIVGGSVGLHPVWIMLALALGGFFFGLVGLLIAVPVAALLKLLLPRGLRRWSRPAPEPEISPAE